MPSATIRDRLAQLHRDEPAITQAAAARRLGTSRQRVLQLAQEMGLIFPRKVVRRGACAGCGKVRIRARDRLCALCA